MLITDLLAGLSAKAALGLGIAATSITGAGVAIALPDAGSHATGTHPAIEQPAPDTTVTEPTTEPTTEATTQPAADEDPQEAPDDAGTEGDDAAPPEETSLPAAASFGQSVAADARDGGVDGQQISAEAKAKANHGREITGQTPGADHRPTSTPDGQPADDSGPGRSGGKH
jgi:hypothetical protein